ncbi:MAG: hypothetical protein IJH64_08540 [Oscillospiraceae bacterium]|nr:hypothetical protein [Oscillospiraceae bacterium]
MGLFGPKKTVKITDVFTADEIKAITDVIDPKLKSGEYLAFPQMMAKGVMDYISRPDKEYGVNKMKGLAKIAKSLQEFEPSLAPILQNGINKIQAL